MHRCDKKHVGKLVRRVGSSGQKPGHRVARLNSCKVTWIWVERKRYREKMPWYARRRRDGRRAGRTGERRRRVVLASSP